MLDMLDIARLFASADAICTVQTSTLEQAQTWRKHVCHTWQTGLEGHCLVLSEENRSQLLGCCCTKPWVCRKFAWEGGVGRVGILCLLVASIAIAPRPARPTVGLEVPM